MRTGIHFARKRSKVRTQSGPPNDRGSQIDSREEVSGELVIAGCNAPPVLEPAKHALDEVAPLVCSAVEVMEALSGGIVWDNRDCAPFDEELP